MKKKTAVLTMALVGMGTLFQSCLEAFWQGLFRTGFPADSRATDLFFDILREDLFS